MIEQANEDICTCKGDIRRYRMTHCYLANIAHDICNHRKTMDACSGS